MESLVLRVKHAPPHYRVEASQSGDRQMQTIGADRRPVAGLDEPAFDSALLERAAGLQQEQPGVLTNRFRSRVPCILMPAQKPQPRPKPSQLRLTLPPS